MKITIKYVNLENDNSNNDSPYYVFSLFINEKRYMVNPYTKFFNSVSFRYFFFLMILSFENNNVRNLLEVLDYNSVK